MVGIEILEKILNPKQRTFSPELANFVLTLDFPPEYHKLAQTLSEKASSGSLTQSERADLDSLIFVDAMISIMQSKSRVALKRHVLVDGE